ncbi:nitrogenase stabilizing/protective protein NifW [Paracoccaceae bacterium Fryx2]|nr:nitrogenase stabilizing/protective protein NifW [Paracoccaceae bacterium Fryx2]
MTNPSVLSRIAAQPSAEAIFDYLCVPYSPEVLNVARLHILKRMGQYLSATSLAGQTEAAVYAAAAAALRRAHRDFETSTPLEQKVFKVLANARTPQKPAFVPLSGIGIAPAATTPASEVAE